MSPENWRHLPIVAFDVETTGLSPHRGDRIIEFAAVVFRVGAAPGARATGAEPFSWLVNPEMPIPATVTRITGLADADVSDKPLFGDIAQEIWALLDGSLAVAHNFPFDKAFLSQEFKRCDLSWPDPVAELDTIDMSRKWFPDARGHKLSDVCSRLGISLEGAHRAVNDAEACGKAMLEMAHRAESLPEELGPMLDWADAIGAPPPGGPFAREAGRVVFTEGPHAGEPASHYPVYLSWMGKARQRGEQGWEYVFSETTRRWVTRWLEVRGRGRASQNPKGFGPGDWVLDSCIASDRRATS